MKYYHARWSRALVVMSVISSVILIGVSAALLARGAVRFAAAFPLLVLAGGALFTIRGYSVRSGLLLVHRLGWNTQLPLHQLQSAQFQPDAMKGSLRVFGNGGLFSFTGLYRNRQLGSYRAFVTDLRHTVVLRFPTRNVVVSPAEPEDFVREVGSSS
jgi:hypothetical protein